MSFQGICKSVQITHADSKLTIKWVETQWVLNHGRVWVYLVFRLWRCRKRWWWVTWMRQRLWICCRTKITFRILTWDKLKRTRVNTYSTIRILVRPTTSEMSIISCRLKIKQLICPWIIHLPCRFRTTCQTEMEQKSRINCLLIQRKLLNGGKKKEKITSTYCMQQRREI